MKTDFGPSRFTSLEDVSCVPLLSREELLAADLFQRLYLPLKDTEFLGYTSGTTHKELFPIWRGYFLSDPPPLAAERILILPTQPWRAAGQTEWFQRQGVFPVCGDVNNLPLAAELAAVSKVDSIYTSPAAAFLLAPHLKQRYRIENIVSLVLYGEQVSKFREQKLKEIYSRASLLAHYASTELGPAGNSCPQAPGLYFYHQDSHFLYEVIDPESGKNLQPGLAGELVVTTLDKAPSPMIRYRTGDMGILFPETCSCKEKRPLFQVLGRMGYDALKIGGVELKAPDFEAGMQVIADRIKPGGFEIHVFDEATSEGFLPARPKLLFKLAPLGSWGMSEKEKALSLLRSSIKIGRTLTLGEAEARGIFAPSEIELAEDIELGPKKRVIVSHL